MTCRIEPPVAPILLLVEPVFIAPYVGSSNATLLSLLPHAFLYR